MRVGSKNWSTKSVKEGTGKGMAGGKWKIVEKNGICYNVNYRGAIKIQKTRNGERVRRSWSEKEEYNVETTEGKIPIGGWEMQNGE